MNNPLAYYLAQAQNRDLERVANRPERLMSEELRYAGRSARRRRRRRA
jgi:hypothetical protein